MLVHNAGASFSRPGGALALTVGRPGRPEEVANLVCFLASPLASYINGVQLYADGGNLPVI